MMNVKELASVFDTIMSIPGMNEQVKIDLKITRKDIFLINQAVQQSLISDPDAHGKYFLDIIKKEYTDEIRIIMDDVLKKVGLTELNIKILNLFKD